MKRKMSMIMVVAAIFFVGSVASDASAQGIHVHGGGFHVDWGSPHVSYYSSPYIGSFDGGLSVWPGHSDWHDTTHLDYHPGGVVRHRNHLHFVPGHYDVHRSGHFHPHF
jgi:hypothetical protein